MEKPKPYFDAQAELKKIRHLDDNEKELSKEERLKLIKERFDDMKKKLADQMMGIAETNAGFERLVFSDDKITPEKLNAFLEKSISAHKLAPWQVEEYKTAIEKIVERRNLVNKFFAENCEGKTGEEIFEFIFDKKPYGKVLVEKGALCLIIFCGDEDFTHIHSSPDTEIVESSDKKENVGKQKSIGGLTMFFNKKASPKFANFGNSLIIIKGTELNNDETNGKIAHENKHIFDNLVFPDEKKDIHDKLMEQVAIWQENLAKISDAEWNSLSAEDAVMLFGIKPIEIQLDAARRFSEATAKEEMLAYYKQGVGHSDIFLLLFSSHGGEAYDVIDERTRQAYEDQLKTIAGGEQEKAIAIEFFKKTYEHQEKVYHAHLYNASIAISRLEEIGVSRDEIIGLFETEPLANWNKIFERIEKSDKYQTKNSMYSLKEFLKSTEDNIEDYRNTIAEAEEQLKQPSENSELYKIWQSYHGVKYDTYKRFLEFALEANKKYFEGALKRKNELETELAELEK